MQKQSIVSAVESVASKLATELESQGYVSGQSVDELDDLVYRAHEEGMIDDDIYHLAIGDLIAESREHATNHPTHRGIACAMLFYGWDRLCLKVNCFAIADLNAQYRNTDHGQLVEFAKHFTRWLKTKLSAVNQTGWADRLDVNLRNNTVTLDNHSFDVQPNAAIMFSRLLQKWPEPVSGQELEIRTTRVVESLPKQLRAIVDVRKGTGVTLVNPKATISK